MAGQPRKPQGTEHPTVCRKCGGLCCERGPLLTLQELEAMEQIAPLRVREARAKRDRKTGLYAFTICPCPALTKRGCLLLYDQRPARCRHYPFVLEYGSVALLDLRCPSWKTFGEDLHLLR